MFLMHNLHGKTILGFLEVDALMVLIENWTFDNAFLWGVSFCWCSLEISVSLWTTYYEKLIKNCKVGSQTNLTIR